MKRYLRIARDILKPLAIQASLAGRFEAERALILTSTPRSGSTWLGSLLRSIPHSCVLFEPMHIGNVPAAKAAGFSWRTHLEPTTPWPAGQAYLQRVFEGRMINHWICKEMSIRDACRARTLIVKSVRVNRLLPWLCETFPIRPPVLLIRHPCAVIASQLRWNSWRNATAPEPPNYLEHLPTFKSILPSLSHVEEYLAASWALDQLPPLLCPHPHPWIVVTYEQIVSEPAATLSRIFDAWQVDVDVNDALKRLHVPSRTVHASGVKGIAGWQERLTEKQINNILNVTHRFGLSFYDRATEPDLDMLTSDSLPRQIRTAGGG